MSLFVRVDIGFFTHRKTVRLFSKIGESAFWVPPRIWAYAATQQTDGNFDKYSAEEIAMLIGYPKDACFMLEALLEAGFMDKDPLRIHDWLDHNGFHAVFSKRASNAAAARWSKEKERTKEKEGTETESETETEQASTSNACCNASSIRLNCVSILDHLNAQASREYRPVEAHLKIIKARLTEVGGDVDGVKAMITRQCAMWKTDPEKCQYLTPDTLFRASKFPKYYDNRTQPLIRNGSATRIQRSEPDHAGGF